MADAAAHDQDRWLAGVASAIATGVGVAPPLIRVAFVLLTLSGGIGLALYAGSGFRARTVSRGSPITQTPARL